MLKNFFQLYRVDNWLKNLLLFFPYFLDGGPYKLNDFLRVSLVFLLFSLFVSSTYIFNDLIDYESDKLHPFKKNRPIAAKKITKNLAISIALLTLFISNLGLYFVKNHLIIFSIAYLLLTLAYSLKLKYVKYFDLISIATLFSIRLLIGGNIVEIEITIWLLLFTFFTSLGLVCGKKLSILNSESLPLSKVKQFLDNNYSKIQLQNLLITTFTLSQITYISWIVFFKIEQLSSKNTITLLASSFLLAIFLRGYYFISKKGKSEDVVKTLLSEKLLFISLFLFSIIVLGVLW